MQISDLLLTRPSIRWDDQLLLALNILGGKHTPYRVVVIDEKSRIKGVISGRRILEVLLGRRGEALRVKKGIKGILKEPVSLFLDEARNIFPENSTPKTILQYMAENNIGYVLIVDDNGMFKGVIDEISILNKLKNKVFSLKVKDIMKHPLVTVSPENTLFEAANLMVDFRIRRVCVIENDIMVGILTVTDILNHILIKEKYLELLIYDVDVKEVLNDKVENVMSTDIISVDPENDLGEAVDKIVKYNVSCLPVSIKRRLLGVLCRIDMVTSLVKIKGASDILNMMHG